MALADFDMAAMVRLERISAAHERVVDLARTIVALPDRTLVEKGLREELKQRLIDLDWATTA